MTSLQTGQLSHNQGVESSDILPEDMQGSNRLPDERSFLDKSFEIAAPVIKQGIGRMVLETGRGINWLVELSQPAEAEASGFSWVSGVGKPIAEKLIRRGVIKKMFQQFVLAPNQDISTTMARAIFKDRARDVVTMSREALLHNAKRYNVPVEAIGDIKLPTKPTFQLENLKSLLKTEAASKHRIKDAIRKLPKLVPLLKDHGWSGEKLTLEQATKHLGGKKSLYSGKWGKYEYQGEGVVWKQGKSDDVLVVDPINISPAVNRAMTEGMRRGHPPGYGWIRSHDDGSTRVIVEIQSDVEHSLLDQIFKHRMFQQFDKGYVPKRANEFVVALAKSPEGRKMTIEQLRTQLNRNKKERQVMILWNEATNSQRRYFKETSEDQISSVTNLLKQNIQWKEDALAGLIVDARKKGLKQIFIPDQKNLPEFAVKEPAVYDAYYKGAMKKVGGFKKGNITTSIPGLTAELLEKRLIVFHQNYRRLDDLMIEVEGFPNEAFYIDDLVTVNTIKRIVRDFNGPFTFNSLISAISNLINSERRNIPIKDLTHAFDNLNKLVTKNKEIAGYLRPLSLALPLGMGLFTNNNLTE
uniref:Uncharacterized protein n=1 Tax=viral metagenome TaxID=1070528 RepID=A0A6M3KZ71_9ZZZZ